MNLNINTKVILLAPIQNIGISQTFIGTTGIILGFEKEPFGKQRELAVVKVGSSFFTKFQFRIPCEEKYMIVEE